MRLIIALTIMCITLPALAGGKKAPTEPPPHQALPAPAGAPLEKLPNKLREVDTLQLKIISMEEQIEALQHNIYALTQQSAQCTDQLARCTAPLLSKQEADNKVSRGRRAEEIKKKYKLDQNDVVNDDGTVTRVPEPAKK